jgi:hypothetical protein
MAFYINNNEYSSELILIGIFEYSILKQFPRVLFRCCEININRGVLIFADFVVHLNEEIKNPTKYFPRLKINKQRVLIFCNKESDHVLNKNKRNAITHASWKNAGNGYI